MFLTSTCNLYTLGYKSHNGKEHGNRNGVYRGLYSNDGKETGNCHSVGGPPPSHSDYNG